MTTLKPCPCPCGLIPEVGSSHGRTVLVACDCGFKVDTSCERADALPIWNNRPVEDALRKERDEAREKAAHYTEVCRLLDRPDHMDRAVDDIECAVIALKAEGFEAGPIDERVRAALACLREALTQRDEARHLDGAKGGEL